MLDDDVLLIRKILSGDDTAFSTLVQKYRKGVHAFAWRKIGDFHFAEEITQDTFIQVYQNLSTLRNPNQFAGWLSNIKYTFYSFPNSLAVAHECPSKIGISKKVISQATR